MSLTWSEFTYRNVLTTPLIQFTGPFDPDSYIGSFPAVIMIDGITTEIYTILQIPSNFQTLVGVEALVVPLASGNMRRLATTTWGAAGTEAYNTGTDSIAAGDVAVTANVITSIDITAAFTGIAAGDLVGIMFSRLGSHANDTIGDHCYFLGVRLRYV